MAGELNMSILVRFMAEQARAQATGMAADLKTVGAAADEVGRKSAPVAPALTRTGAAADVAAQSFGTLHQSIGASLGEATSLTAYLGRNATAMAGAMNAASGLTRSVKEQVEAMRAGQREAALMRDTLDAVRARYNPLFAVSQQYQRELREIAEAERMGAISALEAAAARERAAQAMAPGTSSPNAAGSANSGMARAAAANLSFQMNDIAMMTAMGQSPFTLMIQQGPQVAQIFSQLKASGLSLGTALAGAFRMVLTPWGLLAMGVIGGGAAVVQWLMKMGGETRTFEDSLSDLNETLGRMRSNLDLVGNTRLGTVFGSLTGQAREMARAMLELDRAAELKQISEVANSFLREETDPAWWERAAQGISRAYTGRSGMPTDIARPGDVRVEKYQALGAANTYDDFVGRTKEIEELAKAGDVLGVTESLKELQLSMSGGGKFTDMSKELQKLIQDLTKTGLEIAKIEALWNGSAGAESIRPQVDQLVLGYGQQEQLALAIVAHGENSAQVEELRNRHARELLTVRLREMGVLEGSAEELRAMSNLESAQAAEAAAAADRREKAETRILDDLRRQQEVSEAILTFGEHSVEVEDVRNRHALEILGHRMAEDSMSAGLIAKVLELTKAEQERARAIKDAAMAKRSGEMLGELRDEAAINAAILQYGKDSLQVKELQIAAERRAFEVTLSNMQLLPKARAELMAAWDAARGLGQPDPFGTGQAAQDYLRSQHQRIEQLRIEQALLGHSAAARNRLMALWQAERDMMRENIDLGSERATQIREAAALEADLTTELERQRDAWEKVHRAAEGMIDGPIDALLKGDIKGALASFAEEFLGLYAELAWKNPLKNRMLGTNYATLEDVGGLGGLVGRMFGGAQEGPLSLTGASAMSAAAMSVTTPMVHISTSGLSGIPLAAGLGPAANAPWAPAGPSVAASQLRSVAVDGALRPDALTGLNGPFAAQLAAMVTEAQAVFGPAAVKIGSAFRTVERQAEIFAQAVQKYGSEAAARKWAAEPGKSNHNFGLAADLKFASPAVQNWFHAQAPRFGMGFPMSWEPWHIEPANAQATKAAQSLPVAQLERLATTAEMATGQLGTFGTRAETTGQGLASLGGTFAQALQMFGASKGPGGMIAATLLGGLFKGIGIPGFDRGGWTGSGAPSDVAGLVHAEEFVFDAAATRRIGVGNLEAIRRGSMRGYQTGGYVIGGRPAVPAGQRAAMAAAAPGAEQRHVFEMNVSGTGNAEIAAAVHAAISQAFDQYDRNVFAGRVRMIINDDWAA